MARAEPRISVNKLGEYMVATPSRRRRIIHDQKNPPDFQVARYTEAQEAIARFLAGGASNDDILMRAITRLTGTTAKSEWDQQRIDLCVGALEAFLDFPDHEYLEDMKAEVGDADPTKLTIAKVDISVRPEVTLHGKAKAGSRTVGAVKLYIGKTIPLAPEAGIFVATLVHQYLTDVLAPKATALVQKCVVLDVFAQEIFTAPKSFVRRRNDIEAGCEEIARAWRSP